MSDAAEREIERLRAEVARLERIQKQMGDELADLRRRNAEAVAILDLDHWCDDPF